MLKTYLSEWTIWIYVEYCLCRRKLDKYLAGWWWL